MNSNVTATAQATPAPGPADAPTGPRWQAPDADLALVRTAPAWAELAELSVIDVDGADAVTFLQGQTTADITGLHDGGFALGGYCSPKGRLLAVFHAWRTPTGVRLLLPREIAEATRKRLAMFVLRAKVRLSDVSASWTVLGVCGPGSARALAQAGIAVPDAVQQCTEMAPGERVARLHPGASCPERVLLVTAAAEGAGWRRRLAAATSAPAPVHPGVWWWSQIDAAVPAVFEATRECFVPQAVNLELLGGVNFRKGCYPGQEIVARSQYLGKLRRRMGIAHAAAIGPDGDVYHSDDAGPIGRIVMAATAPGGGWDLLFECPTERTERGTLHAGARDAPALTLRPLPYPVYDPTA